MDEIDAIGGRRFSEGTSADREIQRTLMELLNQLDGFDQLGKVNLVYNLIPLCELILNKKIPLGGTFVERWVWFFYLSLFSNVYSGFAWDLLHRALSSESCLVW
jgi:hypothetical protein